MRDGLFSCRVSEFLFHSVSDFLRQTYIAAKTECPCDHPNAPDDQQKRPKRINAHVKETKSPHQKQEAKCDYQSANKPSAALAPAGNHGFDAEENKDRGPEETKKISDGVTLLVQQKQQANGHNKDANGHARAHAPATKTAHVPHQFPRVRSQSLPSEHQNSCSDAHQRQRPEP